jgi:pSer/pThr/pTyr-binding forkhead associated (FHA) protein
LTGIVLQDEADETVQHLLYGPFTIGRKGALMIDDEYMSPQHCTVYPDGSRWYVEDLGSTNGTYLNGRKVLHAMPVGKGDVIRAGRTSLIAVPL